MNNFKKGGFNKGGFGDRKSFGSKPSFGGKSSFGGKPDFKKKSWDKGGNDFGGDRQMFDAVCSGCGKSCQVPFRPSNGKEVFCNDCFGKVKGDETFVRNDSRSEYPRATGGQNIDAVVRQLQVVASKLDQLIGIMNTQAKQAPKPVTEKKVEAPVAAPAVTEVADSKSASTKKAPAVKKVAAPKKVAAKKAPAKKK